MGMKVTVANINKVAKKYKIKIVKGQGYYYWIGTTDKTALKLAGHSPHTSVYVYRVTDLTWDWWMTELDDILKATKLGKLNESLYVRKDMPQVKTGDLTKAFKIIRSKGVKVVKGTYLADKLKASQKDIDIKKVNSIKLKFNGERSVRSMKPLIISLDGYIVDGHHRWLAVRSAFPNAKVPVIVIGLPIKKALQLYSKIANRV